MYDPTPLREALYALRGAFLEPAIVYAGDQITVEIGYEAGKRFEAWLYTTKPSAIPFGTMNWGGELDRDTDNPKRFVLLEDIRIVWPIGRMAVPGGGSIPRPLPDEVAVIGPHGIEHHPGRVTRIKP